MKIRSPFFELLHLVGQTERKKNKLSSTKFYFPTSPKLSHSKCMFLLISSHKQTQWLSHSACIFTVQILYKLYSLQLNFTYSNYTEAAAECSAAQQLSTFTVKYCTNCTVCNWTVLTVIAQKQPLHVQLHNTTTHLLHKYCINCTFRNWTVNNEWYSKAHKQ